MSTTSTAQCRASCTCCCYMSWACAGAARWARRSPICPPTWCPMLAVTRSRGGVDERGAPASTAAVGPAVAGDPGGVDAAVAAAVAAAADPGTGCRGRSVAVEGAEASACFPPSTRACPGTCPGCPAAALSAVVDLPPGSRADRETGTA